MNHILSFSGIMAQGDGPECKHIMSKLDSLAPSDSHVGAVIHRLADGTYHTIIAINGMCGRFKTEAVTMCLVSSVKQAQKSMLTVLAEWKGRRFEN